jgi:hypothetical protein
MASTKLQISQLDFETIKTALISFLQGQTEFQDYNYAGSGMQVILNILAYNTHYLSYYLNMIANEMFLDSADRRDSIVSIAKQLGYTPVSRKAAQAVVNVRIIPTLSPTPPAFISLDKNTPFTTSINGVNYTFIAPEAVSLPYDSGNTRYLANNLTIVEGVPLSFKWTFNILNPVRFIIPNDSADTSTLLVRVQQSSGNSTLTTYTPATDVNDLNGDSAVYFLQEATNGQYEIYFGDGILGKALIDGNIVLVDYINTHGADANFANIFSAAAPIGGYTNITVTTVNAAFGGAERESTDSIRFTAPKNFETQNRAVTIDDYKTIITRDYPNVDSVAVWGGQDMIPPQYGKVFLSLKPVSGYAVTENTKQFIIKTILGTHNIVSIIPTIIDPDFIFLIINSIVKYNASNTTLTSDQIKTMVISTIENFGEDDIGKFDRMFRYTQLTRAIDDTETSITNDLTTIQMQKRFQPRLNIKDNYFIDFANAISPGTLSSNGFVNTGDPTFINGDVYFFDDDSNGVLRIYKFIGTTKTYTTPNTGTVDYAAGTITITNLLPSDVIDSDKQLRITVIPAQNDVIPVRNNIIEIDPAQITVNMVVNSPAIL